MTYAGDVRCGSCDWRLADVDNLPRPWLLPRAPQVSHHGVHQEDNGGHVPPRTHLNTKFVLHSCKLVRNMQEHGGSQAFGRKCDALSWRTISPKVGCESGRGGGHRCVHVAKPKTAARPNTNTLIPIRCIARPYTNTNTLNNEVRQSANG